MKKAILTLAAALLALSPWSLSAQQAEPPISGGVFNDLDGDGRMGEGEPRVKGATVSLFRVGSSEPLATVVTAADGAFAFADVPAGEYQLQVTYPSGLVVKGEVLTVESDGGPQFVVVPVMTRISAPKFTNFTVVNPANTRGDLVSPFAP